VSQNAPTLKRHSS